MRSEKWGLEIVFEEGALFEIGIDRFVAGGDFQVLGVFDEQIHKSALGANPWSEHTRKEVRAWRSEVSSEGRVERSGSEQQGQREKKHAERFAVLSSRPKSPRWFIPFFHERLKKEEEEEGWRC